MQTTDQTLTMFGNTSSSSSLVDDMASKPILPATTTSQPIDIPFKQTSPQLPSGDRMLTSRKRRDNAHLSDPQWRTQHVMEREQLNLAYQRVVSPARDSTAGSSKRPKEGILRRTSTSCRNKFQKAIHGRSRRSSVDTMDDIEQDIMAQPQQIVPQQQPRALHRLLNIAKPSRNDTPQPLPGAASTSRHFIPSQRPVSAQFFNTNLPPNHPPRHYQHPYDTRGGALARKAVSSHTSKPSFDASPPDDNYLERREQNRRRLGSHSSAADSGADICSSSSDTDMPDAPLEPEIKIDPLSYLPSEINAIIFSHLDAASLRNCQQIPQWRSLAADSLIWRGEYLRSFDKDNYVSPAPIQIGGVGIGKPDVRVQNWQLMHSAREQINANWEMGKGRAIYMAGHTDSVYCVQFDEKKIITGSRDRTIRVWDLNTNRCIKVIGGPAVRPAPGPRVLRTVDYPSFHHAEASVNATPYGAAIYHVPSDFHSASILCLQYDEEILVTGSSDNDLIVWDLETYEPIRRLKQHQGGVLDVAFDAKHIVSCSKDCTIVVWDRKTLLPLRTLNGHNGPVNAVQLRGNLLVSASGDGVARLWDLNKMECVREFPAKERGLAAVEFSDDAKYVLAGGNDHVTYKFEVATGKEVLTYSGHSQLVRSLFLDTQNKRVVSGSYDLDLRVYDYDSGRLITVFPEWTTSWMLAAKCDYRRIVSTSQDGRILMIDFGINQDGQKIEGVDLLAGCEASKGGEHDHIYPTFTHANVPKP